MVTTDFIFRQQCNRDNKKILSTTRNVRLDSGPCATKYYSGVDVKKITQCFKISIDLQMTRLRLLLQKMISPQCDVSKVGGLFTVFMVRNASIPGQWI